MPPDWSRSGAESRRGNSATGLSPSPASGGTRARRGWWVPPVRVRARARGSARVRAGSGGPGRPRSRGGGRDPAPPPAPAPAGRPPPAPLRARGRRRSRGEESARPGESPGRARARARRPARARAPAPVPTPPPGQAPAPRRLPAPAPGGRPAGDRPRTPRPGRTSGRCSPRRGSAPARPRQPRPGSRRLAPGPRPAPWAPRPPPGRHGRGGGCVRGSGVPERSTDDRPLAELVAHDNPARCDRERVHELDLAWDVLLRECVGDCCRSSASSCWEPLARGWRTTNARTKCPPRSKSLIPTTAAARTALCPRNAFSTSYGPKVRPRLAITSEARPTNQKNPSSSRVATSPVTYQSPLNACFVSSGESQ